MVQKLGTAVSGLPPNKRYIATHDSAGQSTYTESPEQVFNTVRGFGGLAHSYSISSVPAELTNDADVKAYRAEDGPTSYRRREIVSTQPSGANVLIIDVEPGGVSGMHRTVSIDFTICVIGEVECEMDSGDRVRLRPGVSSRFPLAEWQYYADRGQDHVVQRGTNHRWHNVSKTHPARAIAVTLPCIPFDIAGEMLKEVHITSKDWDQSKPKM